MPLPAGDPPWFGLDAEALRFLEVHQARALAIPGRGWHDLGDAVMLFSGGDADPFFNRLTAIRWPADPVRFDARLRQALEMFEALDRRPYFWTYPGQTTPSDIGGRLERQSFTDLGGGFQMLLVRDPSAHAEPLLPRGAELHCWHDSADDEVAARAEAVAAVVGEAFAVPRTRRPNLVMEIALTLGTGAYHAYLVTIDGVPAATGQRYTFDGASYLSSIGTRPAWRRRGLGEFITMHLARDSIRDGADLIYLAVQADNDEAIRTYERAGFSVLGERSRDYLR